MIMISWVLCERENLTDTAAWLLRRVNWLSELQIDFKLDTCILIEFKSCLITIYNWLSSRQRRAKKTTLRFTDANFSLSHVSWYLKLAAGFQRFKEFLVLSKSATYLQKLNKKTQTTFPSFFSSMRGKWTSIIFEFTAY